MALHLHDENATGDRTHRLHRAAPDRLPINACINGPYVKLVMPEACFRG